MYRIVYGIMWYSNVVLWIWGNNDRNNVMSDNIRNIWISIRFNVIDFFLISFSLIRLVFMILCYFFFLSLFLLVYWFILLFSEYSYWFIRLLNIYLISMLLICTLLEFKRLLLFFDWLLILYILFIPFDLLILLFLVFYLDVLLITSFYI